MKIIYALILAAIAFASQAFAACNPYVEDCSQEMRRCENCQGSAGEWYQPGENTRNVNRSSGASDDGRHGRYGSSRR